MAERVALLLDGGFVKKKLDARWKRFPSPVDVVALCQEIMAKPRLADTELFRVYYYDAPPLEGIAYNPIDGSPVDFSSTRQSSQNSDFVPAMKFARKEGLRVYLESLGHGVRRELKAHADYCL